MPANPITMCNAIQEIKNFQVKHPAITSHACAISLADILAVIQFASSVNVPLSGIRCYYAKKNIIDNEVSLVVVGTTMAADGIIEDIYDPNTGTGVFDLTTPCPTFCDLNSPLMTLSFRGCP